MTIIGLLLPSIFSVYSFILKSNREIVARQDSIQQWYEFFERLNILMEDYTIDYEEYYDRQMVWCTKKSNGELLQWNSFERYIDEDWYCKQFTAYGNNNSIMNNDNQHHIYKCSSNISSSKGDVKKESDCWNVTWQQSYWQYAALFSDIHFIDTDEDDEELWDTIVENENIDAIRSPDNIQELYLISHDGKRRLYFRRKNVAKNDEEPHYKIQMLRLKWFDAWARHNFEDDKAYDGVIDTWACDYSMWFECKWSSIDKKGGAYANYHLPKDKDDGWVDFTQWSTNIFTWNIEISPVWDADLFWAVEKKQINAFMRIMTVNSIYWPELFNSESSVTASIKDFKVPLITTINMKDFYRVGSD